jgi:outer membrane protein OmpA-like peptidoglycan-associated protein
VHTVKPGCPGIYVQAAPAFVAFDSQQVAVSADKDVWTLQRKMLAYSSGIPTRSTADVDHVNAKASDVNALPLRKGCAYEMAIDVTVNRANGSYSGERIGHVQLAYISSMPNLVDALQVVQNSVIDVAVGVRKNANFENLFFHPANLRELPRTWCCKMKQLPILIVLVFSSASVWGQHPRAEKLFTQAEAAYAARRPILAVELLTKALERDEEYAKAWLLTAQIREDLGQWGDGAVALSKAWDLDRFAYADLGRWGARMHWRAGNYREAEEFAGTVQADDEAWKLIDASIEFSIFSMDQPVPFLPEMLSTSVNTDWREYAPAVSLDGRTLYFTREVDGQEDFYRSTRKDAAGPWDEALPLVAVNTEGNEGAGAWDGAEDIMVFTACETVRNSYGRRTGAGSCDLFLLEGGIERNFEEVNSTAWESQPTLSSDGRLLVFSRARNNEEGRGKHQDLFYSKLRKSGNWSRPSPLPGAVNSAGDEANPFLHSDGKTLYFTSTGHPGLGGQDLFVSRLGEDSLWGVPENLGYPINTHSEESGLFVEADGVSAFFASERARSGTGESRLGEDIWRFELPPAARAGNMCVISGRVVSALDERSISSAEVDLVLGDGSRRVSVFVSDESARFVLPISVGESYRFEVLHPDYSVHQQAVDCESSSSGITVRLNPAIDGEEWNLHEIFFASSSFELSDQFQPQLEQLARWLARNNRRIRITGHTDSAGGKLENDQLSLDRAGSVRDALRIAGIAHQRLEIAGKGSSDPLADNATEEGRARNRRIAIELIDAP